MIRSRSLLPACMFAAVTMACSDEKIVTNAPPARCAALANQGAIDEACAIEIAKAEIIRRQGKLIYSKFSASFDSTERAWAVMAAVVPLVPGGHVFVSVSASGAVRDYMLGR